MSEEDPFYELGLPPLIPSELVAPVAEWEGDPLAIPLVSTRQRSGSVVAVSVTSGGTVSVGRFMAAVGWEPSEVVSMRVLPERNAVFLRPASTKTATGTARVEDEYTTWVESKGRLRLPAGAFAVLNAKRSGSPLIFYGKKTPSSWNAIVIHAETVEPTRWDWWEK